LFRLFISSLPPFLEFLFSNALRDWHIAWWEGLKPRNVRKSQKNQGVIEWCFSQESGWMREEGRYMLMVAITCPLDTVTCWLAFRWWPTGTSWSKRDFQSLYTKRFPLGQCFFHWNRLDCVATDRFRQSMLSFCATVPTIPCCLHLSCFIHLLSSWHPYHMCPCHIIL